MLDRLIIEFDKGLKTLTASAHSVRPYPDAQVQDAAELDAEEKRHAAALMRINHCGKDAYRQRIETLPDRLMPPDGLRHQRAQTICPARGYCCS